MPNSSRFAQPTLLLSSIAIALLTLAHQAADLIKRGLTTMSDVATPLTAGATNEAVGAGGRGGFGTQLTQSYTSSYIDTHALPSQKPGQPFYTETAPYIVYKLSTSHAWNKQLKFTFGVNKLLDVDPPLSNQRWSSRVAFPQNSAKPIGRTGNVRVNDTF